MVEMVVTPPSPQQPQTRSFMIVVQPTLDCSADFQGPDVTINAPPPEGTVNTFPFQLSAMADDAATGGSGIKSVEFSLRRESSGTLTVLGLGSGSGTGPYTFNLTLATVQTALGGACADFFEVIAEAEDDCLQSASSSNPVILEDPLCTPPSTTLPMPSPTPTGTSDPGPPAFQRSGRGRERAQRPRGPGRRRAGGGQWHGRVPASRTPAGPRHRQAWPNTVEATLVDARGAGTWRFELGTIPGLRADRIKVIAGDVVQVGGEALVFRLRGRPGERVVFSFER